MQSTLPEYIMREAIRLSLQNVEKGSGGPIAVVIVKDGVIIASGVNLVTTNNDPTAHAEVTAICEACAALHTFQLNGRSIAVVSLVPCVWVQFTGRGYQKYTLPTPKKMHPLSTSMISLFIMKLNCQSLKENCQLHNSCVMKPWKLFQNGKAVLSK